MEVLDMTNVIASGLTTDELFQRAPRLNKDDITEHLSDNDIQTVEEFEDAWKAFLERRPGILPPGRKIKNYRQIQIQMNEIEGKKQNVCLELQRQLDFFKESKVKLEELYQKAKKNATIQQEGVIKQLENDIDDIALADKLLSEVLPWEHFFENLEANTTTVYNGSVASMSASSSQSQVLKPSGEALYLANVQPGEVVYAARRGNSKAHLLRAYRIDNALLKAKAAMLRKEAERLERTIKSERMLSQILMDNDIWGIIADSRE